MMGKQASYLCIGKQAFDLTTGQASPLPLPLAMDHLVLKGILNLRLKAMGHLHLSILHAFSSSYASAGTEPERL